MWEQIWEWANREVAEVRRAPVAALILVAAGIGIGWYLADRFYSERFLVLQERLESLTSAPPQAQSQAPTPAQATPVVVPQQAANPPAIQLDAPTGPKQRQQESAAKTPPQPIVQPPVTAPIISAPNGIAIGGGTVTNPTVNNFAPAPWLLTSGQGDRLVAALRKFARPGPNDLIAAAWGDPDSTRLADQFAAAFRAAGWELEGSGYAQSMWTKPLDGIAAIVADINVVPPVLDAIVVSLRDSGFLTAPMALGANQKIPAGSFELRIGRRPLK